MNLAETTLYGIRRNGLRHGTVSTKPVVVATMLDLVDYKPARNLSQVRLLDPASGDGVFILGVLERLSESARCHNFSFAKAYANLCVVEIDSDSIKILKDNIKICLEELGRLSEVEDPESIVVEGDFLRTPLSAFDIVIGNPPYVRYDNIQADTRDYYRHHYRTFTHRADLYVPFFEKGLRLLNTGGKLCYICANRWLKNEYGQGLRGLISRGYTLSTVIDLENADPFEEKVGAYPAIALIENLFSDSPICWYSVDDINELPRLTKLAGKLVARPHDHQWQQCFREKGHSHKSSTIEAQGFKIGIGVATGADRVFIGTGIDIENSCLIPILMARDLRGNQLAWNGNYLINPFDANGRLVDLSKYPRLAYYLSLHEEVLRQRHVAKKNPTAWYRTIDKIHPQLRQQPKLLLPDMSANNQLFIDEGNFYPHHNLYFITGQDIDSLKALGALLMTSTVRNQLSQLSTRMNGGYLRWQSQHLRKLLIPTLANLSSEQVQRLIMAFDHGNIKAAESFFKG